MDIFQAIRCICNLSCCSNSMVWQWHDHTSTKDRTQTTTSGIWPKSEVRSDGCQPDATANSSCSTMQGFLRQLPAAGCSPGRKEQRSLAANPENPLAAERAACYKEVAEEISPKIKSVVGMCGAAQYATYVLHMCPAEHRTYLAHYTSPQSPPYSALNRQMVYFISYNLCSVL